MLKTAGVLCASIIAATAFMSTADARYAGGARAGGFSGARVGGFSGARMGGAYMAARR